MTWSGLCPLCYCIEHPADTSTMRHAIDSLLDAWRDGLRMGQEKTADREVVARFLRMGAADCASGQHIGLCRCVLRLADRLDREPHGGDMSDEKRQAEPATLQAAVELMVARSRALRIYLECFPGARSLPDAFENLVFEVFDEVRKDERTVVMREANLTSDGATVIDPSKAFGLPLKLPKDNIVWAVYDDGDGENWCVCVDKDTAQDTADAINDPASGHRFKGKARIAPYALVDSATIR